MPSISKLCPKMPKNMGHNGSSKIMPGGFKLCPFFDLGHKKCPLVLISPVTGWDTSLQTWVNGKKIGCGLCGHSATFRKEINVSRAPRTALQSLAANFQALRTQITSLFRNMLALSHLRVLPVQRAKAKRKKKSGKGEI